MQNRPYFIIAIHILFLLIFYYLAYHFKIFTNKPNVDTLIAWDAKWFNSIRTHGYQFIPNEMCNLAFFPLFPLFWKLTALNAVWISILNFTMFSICLSVLLLRYHISGIATLFLLTIPSFIFFAVPYSESLFFAFGTLIIIGYEENNGWYKLIGFIGSSMLRSVAIIFIPAIIIITFFHSETKKKSDRIESLMMDVGATIAGLLIAAFIQGYESGKWWYFLEIQKFWGRAWNFPTSTLTTSFADRVLGLDSIAFIIGILAIYYTIKTVYLMLIHKVIPDAKNQTYLSCTAVLFSALYLSATTILDMCFTFQINGHNSLWSINRHVLASPFGLIFLLWLLTKMRCSYFERAIFGTILICGIYITGVYEYTNLSMHYALFFLALIILKFQPSLNKYILLPYLFYLFIQLQFFHDFISQHWVG